MLEEEEEALEAKRFKDALRLKTVMDIPLRELTKKVSDIIGRQIYVGMVEKESVVVSGECKIFANRYNCYLQSWITGLVDGVCESYHAGMRAEDDENNWELLSGSSEAEAVLRGFMWLNSFGCFAPEYDQTKENFKYFKYIDRGGQ